MTTNRAAREVRELGAATLHPRALMQSVQPQLPLLLTQITDECKSQYGDVHQN